MLKIVFVKMFFKPIRSHGERSGQGRKRSVGGSERESWERSFESEMIKKSVTILYS